MTNLSDLKNRTFHYKNNDVTVVWKPGLCIHSGNCAAGLPSVFRPSEQPWIHLEEATSQEIIKQVAKCPSGALSIEKH